MSQQSDVALPIPEQRDAVAQIFRDEVSRIVRKEDAENMRYLNWTIRCRQDLDFNEAPLCAVGFSMVCHGQGLYAIAPILEGHTVASYAESSELWDRVHFNDLRGWQKEMQWWVGVDEEYCLVAPVESMFMRANHSRTPNTEWRPLEKRLVALRYIRPGEEITYDYRLEIASPAIKANPPEWV